MISTLSLNFGQNFGPEMGSRPRKAQRPYSTAARFAGNRATWSLGLAGSNFVSRFPSPVRDQNFDQKSTTASKSLRAPQHKGTSVTQRHLRFQPTHPATELGKWLASPWRSNETTKRQNREVRIFQKRTVRHALRLLNFPPRLTISWI